MSPNWISDWNVMTIRISREHPLFNFERLDILCPRIRHPSEMLWPFEFLKSFCCSISSVSIYYFLESDIRLQSYDHSNFSRASVFNFDYLYTLCPRIGYLTETLWPFEFLESICCSISSFSIYYVPESDIRVKCYDHSNFLRDSVVQFRASRYIISQNRTYVWKVMTIRISRKLPLFNFERLDILCPRIGHLTEKLWPFEFLESIRCSISSVLIYYVPESDIRVKCYDHLNFSRASVVQFRAIWYIMSPNQNSVQKVMTIQISLELPLFNFERLDILFPRIGHPCEKLWPFKFLESFRCSISSVSIYYVPESDIRVKCYDHSNFLRASVVQFRAFRYIMSPNRNSVQKVMTIQISLELPLFNFERLDILFPRIGHPREKLWPFEFLESFCCSISSVSIYYVPESDIRVKSYDHWNFSKASVVQFRASGYITSPNWTSGWKVMTIRISRDHPLFNFEHLDILCPRIRHPSEMLWPFEFLKSFCCSISSVLIYYVPKSEFRAKSYDHSDFSRASVVQFRASRYIISSNRTSVRKVMTIRISRELPLFNFVRLDILCPRIGHPSEKLKNIRISQVHPLFNFERLDILCPRIGHSSEMLWPFEFLESLPCSITSVYMTYVPQSDIRMKSYDHSNFSRASVVQFRESRYIMSPNRTSVWKIMTIRIYRELPLFNFVRLDILCPRIGHPSEKLKNIRISQEQPLFNFERLDILFPRIGHPSAKLWPFEFLESFGFQFRLSLYIMSPNWISDWNVMTIRISREHPLFNFERLDILCPRIRHPSEMLWPFEFLESFCCSISSVSIYYVPKSEFRAKTYDHSNFSSASVVQFRASRYIISSNRTSVRKVKKHSNFSRASVVQFRASRYIMSPNRTSGWNVMTIRISWELPLFNFELLDILYPKIGHMCEK